MKPSTATALAILRAAGPDGVTWLEAFHAGGGARFPARVHELRHDYGFDIESHPVPGASWDRYTLTERPVQLTMLDSPGSADRPVPSHGPRIGTPQVAERRPLAGHPGSV